jgi:hypothetical protein
MAAPLGPLPFPRRHLGMMPMASPPASYVPPIQSGQVLSGARPFLKWEGGKEGLTPLRGGKRAREGSHP